MQEHVFEKWMKERHNQWGFNAREQNRKIKDACTDESWMQVQHFLDDHGMIEELFSRLVTE